MKFRWDLEDVIMRVKYAFTLAEVLITLGIIGIVAALTMPLIVEKYQEKVFDTQALKSKTILANGYKLMMAREEIFKIQNIPFLNNCNNMNNKECVSKAHKEAFSIVKDSATGLTSDSLPSQYAITGNTNPSPFNWTTPKYIYNTADGMTFGVIPDENNTSFDIVVDVNGSKNPNVALKDLRKFRFSGEGGQLYDVSEELTQVSMCSIDNLSGCTTQEQCNALASQIEPSKDGLYYSLNWSDGRCELYTES